MTYHRESLLVLSSLRGKVRFPEEAERLNEGRLVPHLLIYEQSSAQIKSQNQKWTDISHISNWNQLSAEFFFLNLVKDTGNNTPAHYWTDIAPNIEQTHFEISLVANKSNIWNRPNERAAAFDRISPLLLWPPSFYIMLSTFQTDFRQ